ncbi:hypothetical protein OQA88_8582 [Cercophora sp. LCS_1]
MSRLQDGISLETSNILCSRGVNKVMDWNRLWVAIFGNNDPVKDSHFDPVVELDEVMAKFETQFPDLVASLDKYLRVPPGEGAYLSLKGRLDGIGNMVEGWMRELFETCRNIPFEQQVVEVLATVPEHIEVPQADNTSPGVPSGSVTADCTHDMWQEPDLSLVPDVLFPATNGAECNGGVGSSLLVDQQCLGSPDTRIQQPAVCGVPGSQMHPKSLPITYRPMAYNIGPWKLGNQTATYPSYSHPPPPSIPLPALPDLAPQRHLQPRPRPPLADPAAQRAVQYSMTASHQHLTHYQPQVPSPLAKFHERNPGSETPGFSPESTANPKKSLRDSGVSDVWSLHSGYGASSALLYTNPYDLGGMDTGAEGTGAHQGDFDGVTTFVNTEDE